MIGNKLPLCPNCGEQVLIPFSGPLKWRTAGFSKAFAHWICIKCGFYIGTGQSAAGDISKDIEVRIIPEIVQKVKRVTGKS